MNPSIFSVLAVLTFAAALALVLLVCFADAILGAVLGGVAWVFRVLFEALK